MDLPGYAIGQAVFIRTDTPDYLEESIPFQTIEEMVRVCSRSYPNLTLEKVVLYSMIDNEACALTLGFISSSKGQRPESIPKYQQ
ncbi:MAG: hypothetical protein SFY81_14800 [Verrucomicrobiota bacterium]|nr:hypothetical protein [Verrucomicrobiota bacterium]